ncbi:hypothetical protein Tco_0509099 [Tanacetum coccineum]
MYLSTFSVSLAINLVHIRVSSWKRSVYAGTSFPLTFSLDMLSGLDPQKHPDDTGILASVSAVRLPSLVAVGVLTLSPACTHLSPYVSHYSESLFHLFLSPTCSCVSGVPGYGSRVHSHDTVG